MKKFEISMVIAAVDKVTGPSKGISASIAKMFRKAEHEGDKESEKAGHHAKHRAHKHGHWSGEAAKEGFHKAFSFGGFAEVIPEVAAAAGIIGGLEGVVEGYKKCTEAADAATASQLKLSTMMMHVKGASRESVAGVMEAAEKMEDKTSYKHTIFENAGAQLSAFGMSGRQIRQMLPAMADYLAMSKGLHATNEDGTAAAKLLGKAYAGTTTALRRQGIVLTAAQEAILKHGTAQQRTAVIIHAIESRAGGLAVKQAQTPEGKAQAAAVAWEKVQEKIGVALLPLRMGVINLFSKLTPYVSRFADMIPGAFERIRIFFKPVVAFVLGLWGHLVGSISQSTGGLGSSLTGWAGPTIEMFKGVYHFIYGFIEDVIKWFVQLWTRSQPGLKALAAGLKPLAGAFLKLWNGILKPLLGWIIGSLVPFLINVLGPVITWLVKIISAVVVVIVDLIAGLFAAFGRIWPIVSKFFGSLWDRIKLAFGKLKTVLGDLWSGIWNGLFSWVEEKWGAFLDLLKKVGSYLGFGGGDSSGVGGAPGSVADTSLRKAAAFDPFAGHLAAAAGGKHVVEVTVKAAPGTSAAVRHNGPYHPTHLGAQGVH